MTQPNNRPKLRFPEFRGMPEWEEDVLGNICSITTGKLDANAMVKNGKYRFYTCAKDFYLIDNYMFDTEALLISGNGANVGHIHYYKGKFNAYQRTYILDKFNKSIIFIKYFLEQYLKDRISKEKKEGNTPYIVISTLSEMPLLIPSPKEQQKIADCLTSLDERISAENDRLTQLKAHKKGLMQKLFPSEGQDCPDYRFPEFQNAPAWEEKKLGEIAYYENGRAHEQFIVKNGKYILVNSKFISSNSKVKKYVDVANPLANMGDILMVLSDVPNGKAIAKCFYVNKNNKYAINQRICRLKFTKINSIFIFFILNKNPYFIKFDDGVKQTNLKKSEVLSCLLKLPSPTEQQKIADCLSALDDLIAAQNEKIAQLKAHKKGLMQQLFV